MKMKYFCMNCKGTVTRDTVQCPHCGIWLVEVECQHCGYRGPRDDFINDRCPSCGNKFSLQSLIPSKTVLTSSGFTQVENSRVQQNKRTIIFWLVLAIIGLVIFWVLIFALFFIIF